MYRTAEGGLFTLLNDCARILPITTVVNGTPSNPATSIVVVPEAPIITMARPIVNSHATASNPFGSLGQSPGYNVQSIPTASSPFSYDMPNFTSQFSNSILAGVPNARVGLGGITPPYTPFSFGGSQIPQMTPNMGGMPAFNPGCNPPTSWWNNQLGGQVWAKFGNKKKGHNNHKGGENGNKAKDNNEKMGINVGEGKREKRKVKFPCKLCIDDHLTHLCPKLAEVASILA
jgi:hypothetical protein